MNIDSWAFCGSALKSVKIPGSVGSIGDQAFAYCFDLTSIEVELSNTSYCSVDGVLFDKDKTSLIQFPCHKHVNVYAIPSSVTRIAPEAFAICCALKSVTIPNNVQSIGYCAFIGCTNLKSAFFLGDAPGIDIINAFYRCSYGFSLSFLPWRKGFTEPYSYGYPAARIGQIGAGVVQTLIGPVGVANTGARWQVDGGPWLKSGEVVGNLSPGTHMVAFKAVQGRTAPPTQFFTAYANQLTRITGTYKGSRGDSYAGMLDAGGGLIKLTLTSTGKFTGTFVLRAKTYRLHGAFDARGDYLSVLGNPPVRVALHVDPSQIGGNPGEFPLTGSIGGEEFSAYPAAYDRDRLADPSGRYTILLRPSDGAGPQSPQPPQGTGYARMTVSSAGDVTISGKLADNTSFSASGPIVAGSIANQFFLYNPTLYRGKGLLAGTLTFENLPDSQCDGSLQWFKPIQKSGGYFKNGFDTDLNLIGARYPQGGLTLPSPSTPGSVTLSGGSLVAPIAQPVTLLPVRQVRVEGANLEKLKVSLDLPSGLLRGSFLHPATKKTVSFGGVIYQRDPNDQAGGLAAVPGGTSPVSAPPLAGGFFLGPMIDGEGRSGDVSLTW
jgi:hypothetical protein